MNTKITLADLNQAKQQGRKITAISCYDYITARLAASAGIEMILVGDSAAQVLLGFESTLNATMDFMVAITAGVRRGAPDACLVADMPFLSYQVGINEAVKNAGRFFVESGVQMVKIEAGPGDIDIIKAVSKAGMGVMAHIGIQPQSISKTGRYRAEGTTAETAVELINLARQMIYAGACTLLLEGVAAEAAQIITNSSEVPVISCGSGAGCDGQILIAPDVLGLTLEAGPKFAKSYGKLADSAVKALTSYSRAVRSGKYPDRVHSYHMKKGEPQRLKKLLGR